MCAVWTGPCRMIGKRNVSRVGGPGEMLLLLVVLSHWRYGMMIGVYGGGLGASGCCWRFRWRPLVWRCERCQRQCGQSLWQWSGRTMRSALARHRNRWRPLGGRTVEEAMVPVVVVVVLGSGQRLERIAIGVVVIVRCRMLTGHRAKGYAVAGPLMGSHRRTENRLFRLE